MDWSNYGLDVSPGDAYERGSQHEWELHCYQGHMDSRFDKVVNLRATVKGPWESYDIAELMAMAQEHERRYHSVMKGKKT